MSLLISLTGSFILSKLSPSKSNCISVSTILLSSFHSLKDNCGLNSYESKDGVIFIM